MEKAFFGASKSEVNRMKNEVIKDFKLSKRGKKSRSHKR
jgi:hypothetical protein